MNLDEIRINIEQNYFERIEERLLRMETDGIVARNLSHMILDQQRTLEKTVKEKSTMIFMPIIISCGVVGWFTTVFGFYWLLTQT